MTEGEDSPENQSKESHMTCDDVTLVILVDLKFLCCTMTLQIAAVPLDRQVKCPSANIRSGSGIRSLKDWNFTDQSLGLESSRVFRQSSLK